MDAGINQERMNAFAQLTMLRNAIKNIACDDPELNKIEEMLDRLNSRAYTLAVVGEFNRGKSSLINALLGMSVLPADITPTTATINRVVYSDMPNARLALKNGGTEEIPISMLKGRVTKISEEAQSAAEQIDEAVIGYPTVFCRNNISILDTPGLNESEDMDDLTFSRMSEADALIFMIHALIPFSTSEARSVCRLLEYPSIKHIMFTVGFIDKVPEGDRERMISLIKKRIIKLTSAAIDEDGELEPEEAGRRKAIIEDAIVVGVSAKMALDAFVNGSMEQLNASGIEDYKKTLMARLTAQQDEWIKGEIRPYLEKTCATFEAAAERSVAGMNGRIQTAEESIRSARDMLGKLTSEINKEINNIKNSTINAAASLDECTQTIRRMIQDKVDSEDHAKGKNSDSLVDQFNRGMSGGILGWAKKKVKELGVYRDEDDASLTGFVNGVNAAKQYIMEDWFPAINAAWKEKYPVLREKLESAESEINEHLQKIQKALELENADRVQIVENTTVGNQDELLKSAHSKEISALSTGNVNIGTITSHVQRLSGELTGKAFAISSLRMTEKTQPLANVAGKIKAEGAIILAAMQKSLDKLCKERDELKVQIESMKSFLLASEENTTDHSDDAQANDAQVSDQNAENQNA